MTTKRKERKRVASAAAIMPSSSHKLNRNNRNNSSRHLKIKLRISNKLGERKEGAIRIKVANLRRLRLNVMSATKSSHLETKSCSTSIRQGMR